MPESDRRTYMTGLTAMVAALAGCPNIGEQTPQGDVVANTPGQSSHGQQDQDLVAGSPPRRLVSTTNREISVPGDYGTIQEAVNQIPFLMRHKWSIDIQPGTYDEDVIVPPFTGEWARPNQQEYVPVQITGNRERPSDVCVGSLFTSSVKGTIPLQFRGLEITRENPYDDEATGIGIYGSGEIGLIDITFSGGTNGVHSYNSQVVLRNIDFGEGILSGRGVTVKHGGFAYENIDVDTPTSGTVGAIAYNALSGRIWVAGNRSRLSGNTLAEMRGGKVWDYENQRIVGSGSGASQQAVQGASVRPDSEIVALSDENESTVAHIDGGTRGDRCTLVADDKVTVAHDRGNISLAGGTDRTLAARETLTVVYDGTDWLEV